jgi:formylglycine-generating enzyme required for sulfatase activity
MRWIPGRTFLMGSEDFYPEERPVHSVSVDGFWMDETPVTASDFRGFVRETRYVTVAERPLDPKLYPHADPDLLVPAAGPDLRGERVRPLRRVRERLGVDERLVHYSPSRRGFVALLRASQSARELARGELRSRPAG